MRSIYCLGLGLAFLASGCVQDPAVLRREVESGIRTQARASWWGCDPEDATEALQSAMDSGVKTLVVDNAGRDWIVRPLQVPSNLEMVFEDGVVVRAKKGEFHKKTDQLFNISGRSNVVLRGEGSVRFVMNKADYQNPDLYERAGHRHTINIFNSQNVLVSNLTLLSSGGDGVYVGSSPAAPGAKDVTLVDLDCLDHHRLGIAVTGGENLTIKRCRFNNTFGTAPGCGIDYEPNYPERSLVNCVIEDCEFASNQVRGVVINLHKLNAASRPVSLTFRNCRIVDNPIGVLIVSTGTEPTDGPSKIEFDRCLISGNTNRSVSFADHPVTNMALILRDCVIDNRGAEPEALQIASGHPSDVVGLRIENLTVIDDSGRPPVKFISRFGNGLVDAVVTNILVRTSAGEETAFDTAAFLAQAAPDPLARSFQARPLELTGLRPLSDAGKTAGANLRFREQSVFLQYARAGQQIPITFYNRPVHRYEHRRYRDPLSVAVWCPTRTQVDAFGIPFDGETNYVLHAEETGVYRFEIDARMQTVSVESTAPGQGMAAAETLYVFGCSGRLYFHVPAGVTNVAVDAGGSPGGEGSTVIVLDQQGTERAAGRNLEGNRILRAARPPAAPAEIWSLQLHAKKMYLRLGAPLQPILSSDPANVLVEPPAAEPAGKPD